MPLRFSDFNLNEATQRQGCIRSCQEFANSILWITKGCGPHWSKNSKFSVHYRDVLQSTLRFKIHRARLISVNYDSSRVTDEQNGESRTSCRGRFLQSPGAENCSSPRSHFLKDKHLLCRAVVSMFIQRFESMNLFSVQILDFWRMAYRDRKLYEVFEKPWQT